MYTYGVIVKEDELGEYIAQAPDFIECFGYGETFAEAIENVSQTISMHIGYLIASDSTLPKPTELLTDEGDVVYVSVEPDEEALNTDMGGQKINMFNCPAPTELKIGKNYSLIVSFDNGVVKKFGMASYIERYEVFAPLREKELFENAQLDRWAIIWNDDLDIAIEEVYEKGVTI